MTSKSKRYAIVAAMGAGVVYFCGRTILCWWLIFLAKDGFRDQHNLDGYPAPQLSSHDWATAFCGNAGIGALKMLSHDMSITKHGREQAVDIKDLIASGEFDRYVASPEFRRQASWLTLWLLDRSK
jgi:hypothetical protein